MTNVDRDRLHSAMDVDETRLETPPDGRFLDRGGTKMPARNRFSRVYWMLLAVLALAPTALHAQQDGVPGDESQEAQVLPDADPAKAEDTRTEETQVGPDQGPKVISGMSILGNQEAPTSLVIVPWKSSELGDSVGISTILDDSRQPVDREVFMRELLYYEIRSESSRR